MRRWIVLLVLATLLPPSAALAQEATPGVTPADAESWLPPAQAFGDGWSSASTTSGDIQGVTTDYANAIYLGPNGGRIFVGVYSLPLKFGERVKAWEGIQEAIWLPWVESVDPNFRESPISNGPAKIADELLPSSVGDNIAFSRMSPFWQTPVFGGIFEIMDGPAILIVRDGNFEGYSPYRDLAELISVVLTR